MIPSYTISGVLPPYIGSNPANQAAMSPYQTTLLKLCKRFATSEDRIKLLTGLINYRQAIKAIGFSGGFQWINGSFVEDVEVTRGRPPNDIDVVTFTYPPLILTTDDAGTRSDFVDKHSCLLDPNECKIKYSCDAYLVNLAGDPETLIGDTKYWFGLFSHQRNTSLWKGMLAIDLDSREDEALRALEGTT